MKQTTKQSKLIATLILIVLAILSVANVTYSYFTASAKAGGDITFGDLQVRFIYRESGDSIQTKESNTLQLYSATNTIVRGEAFTLSLTAGGTPISNIGIQVCSGSCDAYIRFWIDAYIIKSDNSVDTTVNYGKYFLLPTSTYYTKSNSSVANSNCYYSVTSITGAATLDFVLSDYGVEKITTLTLTDLSETDPVPVEMLGEKLQISISFEAVQAANQAFKTVFGAEGDTKGYYTLWS